MLWLTAVLGVRLGLAATYSGFLGVDSGAYGLGILQFFGPPGDYLNTSFERPPLAPGFLYAPFWLMTGGFTPLGSNLYAAVFSMAIFPGFYLLAQRVLGKRWGALATGALALDFPLGEMFVTGVVPITGFGMLALTLWGMLGLANGYQATRWHAAAVAFGVPLVAHTNQTALGIAFVTIPIVWLMLPNKREITLWLAAGTVLALSALPWYLNVLPGQPRVSYPGPLVYLNLWWSSQWLQAIGGLAVGLAVLKLRRRWQSYTRDGYELNDAVKVNQNAVRIMAVLLVTHSVLNVFLSNDEALMNVFYRSSYWMAVPFWICTAYLTARAVQWLRPTRKYLAAAVLTFMAIGVYGVQDQFYGQAYYSDLAGPDVLDALASIPQDSITRIGTNAESRGFYLAALTEKPVAWVQSAPPAASYTGQEQQARCSLGWAEDCTSHDYVSHWLIDRKHTQQIEAVVRGAPDPRKPWDDLGAQAPWLEKTFERGTVEVWTLTNR